MNTKRLSQKQDATLPGGGLLRRRFLVLILILIVYGAAFAILRYGGLETKVEVSALVMPIISEYKSPLNRPTGLAFDGTSLWISSADEHLICSVDPDDGSILRRLVVPIAAPWGLAWDGGFLWVADFDTFRIYRVNITGSEIVSSIETPGIAPTGLSWDGYNLWISDFSAHKFFKVDPLSGSVLQSFKTPTPGYNPSGLTWDGGSLWIADISASYVFKVDPYNGSVISYYYSSGYYPSDLAWDGKHLWLLDYSSSKVYKTLPGEQAYKVTALSVPSWFLLALAMSILPVLLSIFSAMRSNEKTVIDQYSPSTTFRMGLLSMLLMIIAVLGSIYASYELFRIIYSVVIMNKIVFRGDSPLWLYRIELLLCLYTLVYWVYYTIVRVLRSVTERIR